ncbi:MAG: NUDIX domain-containing protein, partial [Gammaproteobacteria bacterium]|nr:NUDIX domain-containing protein [Gammaproteobacteria bacterium]
FPEAPIDQDIGEWANEQLALEIHQIHHWPVIRHTFSHFHLDIHPVSAVAEAKSTGIMESNDLVWYKAHRLSEQGIAAPIKRLLTRLQVFKGNEHEPHGAVHEIE